jgi:16S rRNA C967 or C1407 C5-methylase (RsmB/RsmF family)
LFHFYFVFNFFCWFDATSINLVAKKLFFSYICNRNAEYQMNLPQEFSQYTRQLMGEPLFETFLNGMAGEPPTSIRLNPFKAKGATVEGESVPWCPTGWYLKERPNFTFDPLLHAGLYYVQEAASMFVSHVLHQLVSQPVVMLDLCAAPGGKSTCAMSALPEGSHLFSNEPLRPRAQILYENILKFGHPAITVTNNYACDYQKVHALFDLILADVPCSGEGMFRKDEGAIGEWSVANVEKCQRLQRDIIRDIWPCLHPGGLLVYSTCTFNAYENEENIAWIARELGAEAVAIDTDERWNITGPLVGQLPAYRFIPGKTRGEGLFMAILRKEGDSEGVKESQMQKAAKALRMMDGSRPADKKGKDLIPLQAKALSTQLDPSAYTTVEVSYQEAIGYLRKEALTMPADTPRGEVLLTYQGQPLGFVKNIGNRANNLYPAEWKIKSTHVPENVEIIRL